MKQLIIKIKQKISSFLSMVKLVAKNKTTIGGFVSANYWTSSQSTYSTTQAFLCSFTNCVFGDGVKLETSPRVRAIRYF